MKKQTENWLKIAKYDLKAATLAYKGEMALTCIEKCHDALENLQNDILVILNELNTIYMTTRYPDEIEIIEKSLDDEETTRIFTETKRIFSWLEEKLHKK